MSKFNIEFTGAMVVEADSDAQAEQLAIDILLHEQVQLMVVKSVIRDDGPAEVL